VPLLTHDPRYRSRFDHCALGRVMITRRAGLSNECEVQTKTAAEGHRSDRLPGMRGDKRRNIRARATTALRLLAKRPRRDYKLSCSVADRDFFERLFFASSIGLCYPIVMELMQPAPITVITSLCFTKGIGAARVLSR
jgi:hypothetical protein